MRTLALIGASAALCIGARANQDVMKAIIDSQDRLAAEGFFDRSLERDSVVGQPSECVDGVAVVAGEEFPCDEIDFLSFISHKDLEIPFPAHFSGIGVRASDIWGWLSPSGKEVTLLAMDNGVVAIDSTDPVNPCILAKMPTKRLSDSWGDVKVYENTMYHVKDTRFNETEASKDIGVEVYDLLPLDQLSCDVEGYIPLFIFPTNIFRGHAFSHNLAINTESGLLYSIGSSECKGGLVILDVKTDRLDPTQVGCADADNYTHDVQCVVYDGPDVRYTDSEICFAFNEDTLTIWNIDDPANPVMVSRTPYDNQVYSHQGWVTDDLTLILLDDELDEACNNNMNASRRCVSGNNLDGTLNTTTRVFNIENLEAPVYDGEMVQREHSIDHNLYVWGSIHKRGWGGNARMENHPDPRYAYLNNYLAGVKVIDIASPNYQDWTEVGFFDVAPEKTTIEFAGVWSGYMHPSGVYAASSIERGLFLLNPKMAYTEDFPKATSP